MKLCEAIAMRRMKLPSAILGASLALACGAAAAQASLCARDEQTVWSCTRKAKIYSLCASMPKSVKADKLYLQYRVGTPKHTEFVFPSTRRPPAGIFKYDLRNTMAQIAFQNAGYAYLIEENINGVASVYVTRDDKTIAEIGCDTSTDTLTLTTMMEQFSEMGIRD